LRQGPIMVGRTVAQYMAAGVAGFHLEDQVVNKRCGHLLNKELVSEEVYLSRIRAAVNMRNNLPGDIVIIARTDALQSLGFDVAVSRLKRAIEIGADVAFLEGITSKDECRKVCSVLAPTPVLYNMVHGSVSPQISVSEGKELGFKIMIFPLLAVGAVIESVTRTATALKEQGEIPVQVESAHPRNAFKLCGLEEAMEFDRAAGGSSFSGGA
jgi:2-methylisocitrate lyase-like PEP mutase family enzyme